MGTCLIIMGNIRRDVFVTCTHKEELADVEVEDAHRWRRMDGLRGTVDKNGAGQQLRDKTKLPKLITGYLINRGI